MFATDYPYLQEHDGGARGFLDAAALGDVDKEKIAHGNWDRMGAANGTTKA